MIFFRFPATAESLTLLTEASYSFCRACDVAIPLSIVKVTKHADWHAFSSLYNATIVEVSNGKIR